MIYSAPTCATMLTVAKCFGRSLLVLPLCVALIGCDSASSNDDKNLANTLSPSDNVSHDSENLTQNLQDDSLQLSNESLDQAEQGQSLIAAAQSSNDANPSQSLMGVESSNRNNTLQATLMGDYGGMVPCDVCSSIDVTLNLFADCSVSKTSIYNNPDSPRAPLLESGVYRQDNNTITIVYEDKKIEGYDIQDNHLILMHADKTPNNDYILSRQ
ncbi:MAG: copper resistance protein NlpE N-terminal domain-containing protein [Psychrobacter sp.]|nr:copper resistance protein NlpE N-terminal domain-containing protein [Psychrobacter sp.]